MSSLRNRASGGSSSGFAIGVAVGCLLGTAAALWVSTYAFGTHLSDRMTELTGKLEHPVATVGGGHVDIDAVAAQVAARLPRPVAAPVAASTGGGGGGGAWWTLPSPPNMPSALASGEIKITKKEQEKMDARRKTYGGKGDLPHLGGFVANDTSGQSPS